MPRNVTDRDRQRWAGEVEREYKVQRAVFFSADVKLLPPSEQGDLKEFRSYVSDTAQEVIKDFGDRKAAGEYLSVAIQYIDQQVKSLQGHQTNAEKAFKKDSALAIGTVIDEVNKTKSDFEIYRTISAQNIHSTSVHQRFDEPILKGNAGDGNDFLFYKTLNSNKPTKVVLGAGNDLIDGATSVDSLILSSGSDLAIANGGGDTILAGFGTRRPENNGRISPTVSLVVGDSLSKGSELYNFVEEIRTDENPFTQIHNQRTFSFEESFVGKKFDPKQPIGDYVKEILTRIEPDIKAIDSSKKSPDDRDTLSFAHVQGNIEVVILDREKGVGYAVARGPQGMVLDLDIFIGIEVIRDNQPSRTEGKAVDTLIDDDKRRPSNDVQDPKQMPNFAGYETVGLLLK